MKSKIFEKELSYIKDEKVRKSTETMLELLPDYFYEVEASSTGKYHPSFALGKGGLVRHVKVAATIGYSLLTNPMYKHFNEYQKDLILMAILLHDGLKKGLTEEKYTRFDHPVIMANYLIENKAKLEISGDDVEHVAKMVASHMGFWNTSSYSNVVLPLPKEKDELFVHMADYLASRKFIDVEFNGDEIVHDVCVM